MTALSESLFLMIIHDVFSAWILTYLLFSQVRKPILESVVTYEVVSDVDVFSMCMILIVLHDCYG